MWGHFPLLGFPTYILHIIHSFWARKIGVILELKANFILFEIISGIKLNFHKSLLVGINMEELRLLEAYVVLNCKVGQLPFTYRGVHIGGNSRQFPFWYPLLDNVRKILSGWKSKNLSYWLEEQIFLLIILIYINFL